MSCETTLHSLWIRQRQTEFKSACRPASTPAPVRQQSPLDCALIHSTVLRRGLPYPRTENAVIQHCLRGLVHLERAIHEELTADRNFVLVGSSRPPSTMPPVIEKLRTARRARLVFANATPPGFRSPTIASPVPHQIHQITKAFAEDCRTSTLARASTE